MYLRNIYLFSFIFLLTLVFNQGISQKANELKKIREQKEKEIKFTEILINETRSKKEESLTNLNILQKKIDFRNSYINNLNIEIDIIDKNLNNNLVLIYALEKDKKSILNEYGRIVYNIYKYRKKVNFFIYLLASQNFNQAYKRIKYLQMYTAYKRKQKKLVEAYEKVINRKNEELILKKTNKIKVLNERESEKELLSKDKEKEKSLIKNLKKKEKDLLTELEEKKKTTEKLKLEISKLIEESQRKNKLNSIYENLTPEEKVLSNEFEKNKGKLPWPTTQGIVTGRFGIQQHSVLKDVKIKNDGIFITTVKNEEARAVFNGIVSKIFSFQGSNFTVIIKHGNYYSLYNNLIQVYVKEGEIIKTKQKIGKIFTDNQKSETILQFQVWKERERSDPELWLSK